MRKDRREFCVLGIRNVACDYGELLRDDGLSARNEREHGVTLIVSVRHRWMADHAPMTLYGARMQALNDARDYAARGIKAGVREAV